MYLLSTVIYISTIRRIEMNKIMIQSILLIILCTNMYAKNIDKKNDFAKDELKAIKEAEEIKNKTIAKAEATKIKVIAKAIKDRTIAEVEAIKIKNIAEIEVKSISEMKAIKAKAEAAKAKAIAEAEEAKKEAELLYKETIKRIKIKIKPAKKVEKEPLQKIENNESIQDKAVNQVENSAAEGNISNLLKVRNIEFKRNKAILTQKGIETVVQLSEILNQYPSVHIEIAGYTDSDGSKKFNLNLSQARVNAVKKILVSSGIDESRLVAKGYGEAYPLVPNTSKKNKQKNRRVEIHIIRDEKGNSI